MYGPLVCLELHNINMMNNGVSELPWPECVETYVRKKRRKEEGLETQITLHISERLCRQYRQVEWKHFPLSKSLTMADYELRNHSLDAWSVHLTVRIIPS